MKLINRILCPTDLSPETDQALRYSLALARANEAKVVVCYCAQPGELYATSQLIGDSTAGSEKVKGRIQGLFAGTLNRFLADRSHRNPEWEGLVIEGEDIGDAIADAAATQGIDLIVMRSRRRPHRAALLGSTAESVCRTAPCPVLVTHSDEREWIDDVDGLLTIKRILVAYDFSDYSELALRYAISLAQEHQAELHLLHVLPPKAISEPEIAWYPPSKETAYQHAARRLQKAIPEEVSLWCKVKNAIGEGRPYREVLHYAEKNQIDLISIGAHGAGFGMRALFGSNVDRVLRQAPCPVLVARPLKPAVVEIGKVDLAYNSAAL
jgi:nucleotide-binding universal stress UspA family protein